MASRPPFAVMRPLERSVFATLSYFDLFDYPLTLAEVARFRFAYPGDGGDVALSDVRRALDAVGAGERDGFRYLEGRDALVGTRLRRYRLAAPKFRRARLAARLIGLLPSVRYVAVCNSLAIANADTESDIDLFVIARRGTLWITRFVIVSVLAVLRLRPTEETHADKLCLSFFVSDAALDLSVVALDDDPYLRCWVASLTPLYDDGVGEDFLRANEWVGERLPGWRRDPSPTASFRLPGVGLMRVLDVFAKRVQTSRFPPRIRDAANVDSRVVVTDDMLKFHVNDRRKAFADAHRERLARAGLPS